MSTAQSQAIQPIRLMSPVASLAPRVVILGGGFAGLYTAQALAQACRGVLPIDIILVNRQNFFLFTPMLAEATTGAVEIRHIIHPIRPICRRHGVAFREMEVESIDLARKLVWGTYNRTRGRHRLHYDYLVIALGSDANLDLVPGVKEHCLTFKDVGDAVRIRNRIIDCFEQAELEEDPWVRRELLTVVVAGAGHAGVELIAGLADLMGRFLVGHYQNIRREDIRLVLVGSRVLPETAPELAAYTQAELVRRGIEVIETRVADVKSGTLLLKNGQQLWSRTIIWAAGVRVSPVVASLDCAKGRGQRIRVNDFFEMESYPGVYALGDNAYQEHPDSRQAYHMTAQVAVRQAQAAAESLLNNLLVREKRPFRFIPIGEMVPLGQQKAVANIRGWKFSGFFAWWVWKTVYLLKLPALVSRVRVVLDWTLELFFGRDISEVKVDESGGNKIS